MKNAKIRALKRRKKGLRTQLNILWHRKRERKGFEIEDLIYIAETTDYLPLTKKAVTEFLSRDDPNFNDFYRMLEKAREALDKYEGLKKSFWRKYFVLCTIDNLAELAEDGEEEATKKLLDKTEDGSMRNNKAKQVLIRLFEKFTKKEIRMDLWRRIKKLDPNEGELRYLLDLESMYSLYEIRSEIEKLLRERHKTKENKITKKLLYLAKQIKTKKGQS